MTVNWLTASQSLASGSSKSISRTCSPPMVPSGRADLDRNAFDHVAVQPAVLGHQERRLRLHQPVQHFGPRLGGERRVQPCDGGAHPVDEQHIAVIGPLRRGSVRADVEPRSRCRSQARSATRARLPRHGSRRCSELTAPPPPSSRRPARGFRRTSAWEGGGRGCGEGFGSHSCLPAYLISGITRSIEGITQLTIWRYRMGKRVNMISVVRLGTAASVCVKRHRAVVAQQEIVSEH